MDALLVLIGLFFATTGAFAIIQSLRQLGKEKADSSLETNLFKLNAPAGFVYGIFAILIVVGLIKYHNYRDQSETINELSKRIKLQESMLTNRSESESKIFVHNFPYTEPASIFGGKILVKAKSRGFSSGAIIQMIGTLGIRTENEEDFTNNSVEVQEGDRFYFLDGDSTIWGVNVISVASGIKVEIFDVGD